MNKVLSLLILLFIANVTYAIDSRFVVVIDAGHGGKDTGATRGGYKEKDINLGVVLALGQLIERNHKDVKVVYTRKSDVFVDLDKRADIANKAKANLFISVHTNSTAAKSTTVSGADTYILGLARSEENLQVAIKLNPENPRPIFLLAFYESFLPDFIRSKRDFCEEINKAKSLYQKEQKTIEKPHWGEAFMIQISAKCNK